MVGKGQGSALTRRIMEALCFYLCHPDLATFVKAPCPHIQ